MHIKKYDIGNKEFSNKSGLAIGFIIRFDLKWIKLKCRIDIRKFLDSEWCNWTLHFSNVINNAELKEKKHEGKK